MRELILEEIVEVSGGESQTTASKAGGWRVVLGGVLVEAIAAEALRLAQEAWTAMTAPPTTTEPESPPNRRPGPVSGGGTGWVDPGD